MNQNFNEKRGITDEDIKKYEEDQKDEYSQNKFTNKIRITSGGSFKDFEKMDGAIKYLEVMVLNHGYASMNIVCPELFWPNGKCPQITSSHLQ